MVKSDFLRFSANDFILDDSFQQWVINPHVVPSPDWHDWLREFPTQKPVVEKAKSFVKEMMKVLDEAAVITLEDAETGWKEIENRLT